MSARVSNHVDHTCGIRSFRPSPPKYREMRSAKEEDGSGIHGSPSGMTLVMDFDSSDAIEAMFESEDAALRPARDRGSAEMNILLTHTM